jgi:glycosyltransferase involved in cell wall biosynthesis
MEMLIFCHPSFLPSQSMPRFAHMLKSSFEARGHTVDVLSPRALVFNLVPRGRLSKWAGYFDQYVLFPMAVRKALRRIPQSTLLVFCDQALGPWVPLAKGRPHVVHVHDLLALRSALGDVPENPTSFTGRIYQRFIRRGFRHSLHFISVSNKTRDDLHRFGGISAVTSEVVYNGLNFPYAPLAPADAHRIMNSAGLPAPAGPILLHIGGGQWYKNLRGVVAIYGQFASKVADPLPLWCVGPDPGPQIEAAIMRLPDKAKVLFFNNLESATLQALYSCASAFIFPSFAEGFGWPLIEAQACGCPVLTTDEPPMNEVAGETAYYIPRLTSVMDLDAWARNAVRVLRELLDESPAGKEKRRSAMKAWVQRFDAKNTIDGYLTVYDRVRNIPPAQCSVEPRMNQGAQV